MMPFAKPFSPLLQHPVWRLFGRECFQPGLRTAGRNFDSTWSFKIIGILFFIGGIILAAADQTQLNVALIQTVFSCHQLASDDRQKHISCILKIVRYTQKYIHYIQRFWHKLFSIKSLATDFTGKNTDFTVFLN